MPPPPDPHYFTGEPSRGSEGTQPAREKPRMGVCAPTAAAKKRLNNHLLLQGASRLTFCLRGRAQAGRPFTGTCTVLAKTRRKSHRVPVPHLAAGFVTCSASFPLDLAGHRQPPGGTSNRGAEAPLIGRFKGMGYLGEGGNRNPPSPRQLFGNFLSAQKVTRPEAKHSFSRPARRRNVHLFSTGAWHKPERADEDIGPYGEAVTCYGGRISSAPTKKERTRRDG